MVPAVGVAAGNKSTPFQTELTELNYASNDPGGGAGNAHADADG